MLPQIYHPLFCVHCLLDILRCTAPGMGDIGDDIVGLFDHPIVMPGDSIVWVDKIKPFREYSVGVVIILSLLARHISQYNGIVDLRILYL